MTARSPPGRDIPGSWPTDLAELLVDAIARRLRYVTPLPDDHAVFVLAAGDGAAE